jgi:uncharacterized protein YjbI with pentapeptide repeats
MTGQTVENQQFLRQDFSSGILPGSLFESCSFTACRFAGGRFASTVFRECSFKNCDFSLADLSGVSLQEAVFTGCKLLGVQFSLCRQPLLSFRFEECLMRMVSFAGLKIRETRFSGCDLAEADFTGADLAGSVFDRCGLGRASFMRTSLEKADLRSAVGYSIDPAENRLRKARVSYPALLGLLDASGIEVD